MDPIYRLPPYKIESIVSAEDLAQVVDWGLQAYGVSEAWKVTQGKGIKVAILDTGIEFDHQDLAGQWDVDPVDFTGSPYGAFDKQGHGTHCAGITAARNNDLGVVGVAPQARLFIGKVLGDDGSGQGSWIAKGIDWAVEQKVDIISMSLGSPAPDQVILNAIGRAVAAGISIVCAAGNSGPSNPTDIDWPGRDKRVVAVASVKQGGELSNFSSRGKSVAIAAPGEQILSTFPTNRYAKLSGTSMATPFIAGVVALILSRHKDTGVNDTTPIKTREDLVDHLKRYAIDPGPPGKDTGWGWGIVKVDKLIESIAPTPIPPTPPGEDFSLGPFHFRAVTIDGHEGIFVY